MGESGYGKTWALQANGDIKLTELNSPEFIEGTRAVVQDMKVTLATIRGEDPFDENHGLDMFTVAGGSDEELRFAITEALLDDYSDVIQEINEIEINDPDENRERDVSIDLTLVDNERYTFGVIV